MGELQIKAKELVDRAISAGSDPRLDRNWIIWSPPTSHKLTMEIMEFSKSRPETRLCAKL